MQVITSKDDEGNGFDLVYYTPSKGIYEDKELRKLKGEITTRGFEIFINKYKKINEKKDEISIYSSISYLETAMNLKKTNYLNKIIKELKQFY
jgi:hypothetical protein